MLGSLASLGSLVRMSGILHERGKSIPALPLRLTTVKPEQVVTAIPVIGMSNFLQSVAIRGNQEWHTLPFLQYILATIAMDSSFQSG